MKRKNLIYLLALGVVATLTWSCSDFLDTVPDNRTELDSEEKIINMLVSAYADHQPFLFTVVASDNTDDHGNTYSGSSTWSRFWEEAYSWRDIQATENEDTKTPWESCYTAIASANKAVVAFEEMPLTSTLAAARGVA